MDEMLGHVDSTAEDGVLEGVLPVMIADIGIGAECEQRVDHGDIIVLDGENECGIPLSVFGVEVEVVLLGKAARDVGLAVACHEMESCPSLVVAEKGIGAQFDERIEHQLIAAFGSDHESGRPLGAGCVGVEMVMRDEMTNHLDPSEARGGVKSPPSDPSVNIELRADRDEKIDHRDIALFGSNDERGSSRAVGGIGIGIEFVHEEVTGDVDMPAQDGMVKSFSDVVACEGICPASSKAFENMDVAVSRGHDERNTIHGSVDTSPLIEKLFHPIDITVLTCPDECPVEIVCGHGMPS